MDSGVNIPAVSRQNLPVVSQGTRAYKERINFEIFVDLRNSGPSRPQNRTF